MRERDSDEREESRRKKVAEISTNVNKFKIFVEITYFTLCDRKDESMPACAVKRVGYDFIF